MKYFNRSFRLTQNKPIYIYISIFIITVFFTRFVATTAIIYGPSMENTLFEQDIVFVWKLGYKPIQGDIVLLNKNNPLGVSLIKRTLATGGQLVKIETDGLSVNGRQLSESYLKNTDWDREYSAVTVPDKYIFLMGDNRNDSIDSRDIGCVEQSEVIGKVVFRLWPIAKLGSV